MKFQETLAHLIAARDGRFKQVVVSKNLLEEVPQNFARILAHSMNGIDFKVSEDSESMIEWIEFNGKITREWLTDDRCKGNFYREIS